MAHRKGCAGSPGHWPTESHLILKLQNAVAGGSWCKVQTLLNSWHFCDSLREWAVTEILGQAQGEDLSSCIFYVMRSCPGCRHLHSTILDICLHRRLWGSLSWVLEEGLLDADQRCRAIEEISQHGDEWNLSLILRHCADDELDSVFDEIRRRGLWNSVVLTLEAGMRGTRTPFSLTRVVEKAVEYADSDRVLHEILPYCADDQLDSVLEVAVRRDWWDVVFVLLQWSVSETGRRKAVEAAIERADDDHLSSLLSYCADDQISFVVETVVSRRLWSCACRLLKLGRVSETQRSVLVREVISHADSDQQVSRVIPHCTDDEVETALHTAVQKGMLESVGLCLERGVPETQWRWALEEVSARIEQNFFLWTELVSCCRNDQREFVLRKAVDKEMWKVVQLVLRENTDSSLRVWAVEQVSLKAEEQNLIDCIRSSCRSYHWNREDCDCVSLDCVIEIAVCRNLWAAVGASVEHNVSINQRRFAVEEARKHANDEQFSRIAPYCTDDQLNSVLEETARRHLWDVVVRLFRRINETGITDTNGSQRAAMEEAFRHADLHQIPEIVSELAESEVECLLDTAVNCGMWDAVIVLLERVIDVAVGESVKHNVSINQRRFAVEEARKHANDKQFSRIAPHCTDDQLNSVLEETARRHLWDGVVWLLKRINKTGITDTNGSQRAAAEEAFGHADRYEISQIVSELAESELECLLDTAVNCGMWDVVIVLLERVIDVAVGESVKHNVSINQRRFAVEEARKHANDKQFSRRVRDIGDNMKLKWAVEEAYTHADDEQFSMIALFCHDDQLEAVLREAVKREEWYTVLSLIHRIAESDIEKRSELQVWALLEASQRASDTDLADFVSRMYFSDRGVMYQQTFDTVLRQAVQRGLWYTVGTLFKRMKGSVITCRSETLRWALEIAADQAGRGDFRKVIRHVDCHFIPSAIIALMKNGKQDVAEKCIMELFENLESHQMLSSWARLFEGSLVTDGTSFSTSSDTDVSTCLQPVMHFNDMNISVFIHQLLKSTAMYSQDTLSAREPVVWSKLHIDDDSCQSKLVYETFFRWCIEKRGQLASLSQVSLPLIASQAVNPALQRLARTSMWEETRRWYLQFLVEEKLWDIVKELADHSLYDDQRGWALGQALYDKQWDVMVLLADHGLTDDQLRRVYRQVAKHADWHTVRQLFERGVDMRVVCEELMAANPSRERPPDRRRIERYRNQGEDVTELEEEYKKRCEHVAKIEAEYKERCRELTELERAYRCQEMTLEQLLLNGQWYAVLTKLREGTTDQTELVLHHAMQMEAWHVVMQLVRLGMDTVQRDSLFSQVIRRRQWGVSQVIRRRQWGVGRALLERGVSVELSRAALPELMEADQWILVARVMELSLDDTERRRVMQAALDKKEGSVVAHGISVMEGRLSVEEREFMYDQALSQGVWQAVKRLVEEKDNTGMAQRDKALIAAVDQHRWDMVDHCDKHGADINKRDAEGDTLLHEKTKQKDWDRAMGLLHHGADPNLPDRGGNSALDTALDVALEWLDGSKWWDSSKWWDDEKLWDDEKWWDVVNSCLEFHGNINRPDSTTQTPLYKLILAAKDNSRRSELVRFARIIDSALLWGGQVDWSTDCEGKTALHVLCQAGQFDSMRYLVARGGDPFAVTDGARSVLSFALQYESTRFTVISKVRRTLVAECIKLGISTHHPLLTARWSQLQMNTYSVVRDGDIVILHMLYESGACSNKELHQELMRNEASRKWNVCQNEKRFMSYIRKWASSPRSLKSMCRLVISHSLGVGKPRWRQRKAKQLPLLDKETRLDLKGYVIFSDLVDPHFGQELRDLSPFEPVDGCSCNSWNCYYCTFQTKQFGTKMTATTLTMDTTAGP